MRELIAELKKRDPRKSHDDGCGFAMMDDVIAKFSPHPPESEGGG